jgi:hypothetical protein
MGFHRDGEKGTGRKKNCSPLSSMDISREKWKEKVLRRSDKKLEETGILQINTI